MTKFSKEYYEKENIELKGDFSIEKIFQKLKPNSSISEICEGFGEITIIDKEEECFIKFKDGTIKSYEDLTGHHIEKKDNISTYKSFLWIASGVLVTWIIFWIVIYLFYGHAAKVGEYGDMFGAVNSLFSGLAFAGIIYTIMLQRRELKLQRSELRQTREEFKIQNDTLAKQRFENTFFQMIDLHHKIIDKLKYFPVQRVVQSFNFAFHVEIKQYNGREVFDISKNMLSSIYLNNQMGAISEALGVEKTDDYDDWKLIQKGYKEFYYTLSGGNSLHHYYMNIYQIFKLIHLAEYLSDKEKKKYASIVRAQLTESELFLLLYNGMFENHGNPKFLYLMGMYKVLDNINPELAEKIKEDIAIFHELIEIGKDPFIQENPAPIIPSS